MKEATIRIIITIISAIADICFLHGAEKVNQKEVKSNDKFRSSQKERKVTELKVFHLEESPWFYVESEEGKICYKVCYQSETEYMCNCADFARGFAKDSTFMCKHLLAVINSVKEGDAEDVRYLERYRPKLDESFIKKIDDRDFVSIPVFSMSPIKGISFMLTLI
jgi:hypothetical protein